MNVMERSFGPCFRLAGKKKGQTSTLIKPDGLQTTSAKENADLFAPILGQIHRVHEGPAFDDTFRNKVEEFVKTNGDLFTPREIVTVEPGDDHCLAATVRPGEVKTTLSPG